MSARAIFRGRLELAELSVPVRFYSAVEDRGLHFRLLHESDGVPVAARMVHPESGEEVDRADVRRGYEVEPGRFVVLRDEELEALAPERSRIVELVAFVASGRIGASYYDRPYWLGPEGRGESYFALAAALPLSDAVGVVRWTMRKRRYVGALHPEGPYLMVTTLRHPSEVVPADAVEVPEARTEPKEARLAEQLVSALEGELDPAELHDEHRARVLEMIEAKARGRKLKLGRPVRKAEPPSLADALEASLAAARRRAG